MYVANELKGPRCVWIKSHKWTKCCAKFFYFMGAFASIQPFFTFAIRFLSHWYWILFLTLPYWMFRSFTNAFICHSLRQFCVFAFSQLLMSFYCKSATIPGLGLAVPAPVLMIYSPSVCMYVCVCIYSCTRVLFLGGFVACRRTSLCWTTIP